MRRTGPWSKGATDRFLQRTVLPLRVACNGRSGHPILASLWFVPLEGRLWCATQRSASVARLVADDGRCAFELSVERPPYLGVRGTAIATLHPERGEEMLRILIDRYLGDRSYPLARTLLARAESEVAIALEPLSFATWDYRERMRDSPTHVH